MADTDLQPHRGHPPTLLPSTTETERLHKAAVMLAHTEFVPASLRGKPEAIMAAMLTGREMGIHPMRSLRQIAIVDGRPAPSPELMMALALKAGHYVRVVETDHERCTVAVRRADWPEDDPPSTLTWTLDDAVRAGLCTLDDQGRPRARSQKGQPLPWEQYTRAMLRSRAVTEACRAWLPDVVEGYSYAPEELGAEVTASGQAKELADIGVDDPYAGMPDELRDQVAAAMDDSPVDNEKIEQEEPPDAADSDADRSDDEAELPFDWRGYAQQASVTVVQLLNSLRADWPHNSQWNKPNRSKDIDELASQPEYAGVVKAAIDDLGGA